jgi:hypothetical protein
MNTFYELIQQHELEKQASAATELYKAKKVLLHSNDSVRTLADRAMTSRLVNSDSLGTLMGSIMTKLQKQNPKYLKALNSGTASHYKNAPKHRIGGHKNLEKQLKNR